MRHWGDVQLWENKHEGAYTAATGTLAGPTKLLLSLGRDFDSDFVQLIKASAYPACGDRRALGIANEIRNFSDSPNVEKLPKVALSGNLQEIAIRSMNDLTGVVASLLGHARAGNAENAVIIIPKGGEQKSDREMRVIDFLSQELQIAVDSIKSAYPNNTQGLDAVKRFLDEVEAEAPWLKDFKDSACYRDRPCAVSGTAQDTVSRIARLVNSYWRSPDLKEDSSPRTYEAILFGDVPHAPEQLEYALKHRADYRQRMGEALTWRDNNEGSTRMIREVAESTKASKQKILTATNRSDKTYSVDSWVSAYWKAAHQAETGDAGLVFMIFADEIVDKLKQADPSIARVIDVYAVQYGSWSTSESAPWKGQQVTIRVVMSDISGKQKMSLEMKWEGAKVQTGWHPLGLVGEKAQAYLLPGHTREMKIYSINFR